MSHSCMVGQFTMGSRRAEVFKTTVAMGSREAQMEDSGIQMQRTWIPNSP